MVDSDNLIQICKARNADAVIPGYGFLSEDAAFADKVQSNGIIFIGPSSESILEMGQKHRARALAMSAGVPVVPGTGLLDTEEAAIQAARTIGYPVSHSTCLTR
jgi:urea carboxylase